jgi:hypothetical protein
MGTCPRLGRAIAALGIDAAAVPRALEAPGPFGVPAIDLEAAIAWLAARGAERPAAVEAALTAAGPATDGLTVRLRAETLRALAPVDAAAAARIAQAVPERGPFEDVLRLGALARLSALAAARTAEADHAVMWAAPLLAAPRPVARLAALRLAEIGVTEGPVGRRARAVLEDGLVDALQAAHGLGASGELAAALEPGFADLALPGIGDRAAAAAGRIVDLVAMLGGLAAHREGLAGRLQALARHAPAFVGPGYVAAYLASLGTTDPGPYLPEVRDHLVRAAADRDPRVRALAVDALGGHLRAAPALVDVVVGSLTDAEPAVRAAAALALAEAGAASDAAAGELADLVRLGSLEEALAAARALVRCGRPIPAHAVAERDDSVLRAAVALIERPSDETAFGALLDARAEADTSDEEVLDERVRPRDLLVGALRGLSVERAAVWLARFADGEAAAAGEVWFHALDGVTAPSVLVEAGAPLVEAIAGHDEELAALAALVAARLAPHDARLEDLILGRTTAPVSLIALGSLARLAGDTAEVLLAIADEPGGEHGALAIEAIGRCGLAPDRARAIGGALVGHVRDGDPLAEVAHGALLELVERGALT